MLAALGFATIAIFLFAIMTKRVSVLVALILIPTAAGLVAGAGAGLGKMMLEGINRVAPVGVMIIFAVLYFGLMLDVGLFEPMIRRLLRFVKGDPLKVALATAVLTMAVSLDGDGATTFLITVSAMLPLYQRLGMNRLVLSGIVALGAGVMNIIPWGGPTVRAMAALKADSSVIFNPVVPAMLVGILWVLIVAYIFGRRERARLLSPRSTICPPSHSPHRFLPRCPATLRSDLTRMSPTGRSTRTRASGRSRLNGHGCSGSTPF
jgi:citrate-Mg2+:H+ or citrate-Ca2+:H+ symporter, CitMHS family